MRVILSAVKTMAVNLSEILFQNGLNKKTQGKETF